MNLKPLYCVASPVVICRPSQPRKKPQSDNMKGGGLQRLKQSSNGLLALLRPTWRPPFATMVLRKPLYVNQRSFSSCCLLDGGKEQCVKVLMEVWEVSTAYAKTDSLVFCGLCTVIK